MWLSSGESIDTSATIWTGGAAPAPLLRRSGLAEQPNEWAPLTGTLQSKLWNSVFVAGDAAEVPHLAGKQAYYAMDMGRLVARNIASMLAGKELKEFQPSSKPKVISLGDLQTYVIFTSTAVASPFLAGLKEGIFQAAMAKFDPPRGISSVWKLYGRTSESLFNLTLPTLISMLSLKRLSDVRFLT